MKAPKEVKFGFDPTEKGVVSFTNEIAKIIYCCIRSQHIIDDKFDARVLLFAESLTERQRKWYSEFKEEVHTTFLEEYGRRTVREYGFQHQSILDDDFWIGVWEYINGWETLTITIKKGE